MADIQTNGKGTRGRVWHTNESENIAFSVFVQMDCNIKKLDGITTEIAEIIIDILDNDYGIKLEIKAPNDIVYNNKKIGGILTETKTISETVKYLVIGIGINTNAKSFPKEIENTATSIKNEFGVSVKAPEFIAEFCNRVEKEILKRSEM